MDIMKEKPPRNFCGLDRRYTAYETSAIVILPVPFDRTSTWMKGSRRGPRALIDASRNLELYDIETDSQVYERGIHTAAPVRARRPEKIVGKVYDRVASFLADGKFTVVLGGEHTVSVGAIGAHHDHHPGMSLLHLDAHGDRRDTYGGSRYSHACVISRAREMVDTVVSVGVRSMELSEKPGPTGDRLFYASECDGSVAFMKEVVQLLTGEVYVTVDLDVFDPGILPSTGTPEPGGLGWYQVLDLLHAVTRERHVVGFDVVELLPSRNRAPDFLAAKLVYRLLSLIFEGGS